MPFTSFKNPWGPMVNPPTPSLGLSEGIQVLDLDLVEYEHALSLQLAEVEQIWKSQSQGKVFFCRHPEIVTLGRSTQRDDVTSWDGPVLEVSRGGRATYHGPSQLVIYPLLNLNFAGKKRRARDINSYLRNFEQALVETLGVFGIKAEGKSLEDNQDTGIWVGSKKIASLGVAVRHWVSYHGAAINIEEDPRAFRGIRPCGLESSVMTSVEKEIGRKISIWELQQQLMSQLNIFLG